MRRILVENARRRQRPRYGGGFDRHELKEADLVVEIPAEQVLQVNDALDSLQRKDGQTAQLVKLHFFAGFTIEEAAKLLGIPSRTAYREWTYARAWLFRKVRDEGSESKD
jgi:RNA polymerase sigma factor (TIGR02999 family)